MKDDRNPGRGRVRATTQRRASRGSWWLTGLWAIALGSVLVPLFDGPPWTQHLRDVGTVAGVSLILWWAVTGFVGYEHRAGLRLLRRPGAPSKSQRWLLASIAAVAVGLVLLVLGLRSAPIVLLTALAALLALVLVLVRRFSVFASISMVGIALGVAALIVVQSVATGFQHEFERRVLGVYAHVNVTHGDGIIEYRRFEAYLRTVEGVEGASPFVYYYMALAPEAKSGTQKGEVRQASVLVKGIDPTTAAEVIDLPGHLRAGSGDGTAIDALTSDLQLQPVPDRDDDRLPPAIADVVDPRGPNWYPETLEKWSELPAWRKYRRGHARFEPSGDPWQDPWPDLDMEHNPAASPDDALPTLFVGVSLARELRLAIGDVVMLVDPKAGFDRSQPPEFRRYRIAGIFRAGFQEYDTRLVYVDIKELQWFKYSGKDKVSGIDLRLRDPFQAPLIGAQLRQVLGEDDYAIVEWQKLNAHLFQSIRTHRSVITVLLGLVSLVAGFNVLAALWAMVVRRTPEIAILMAMGSTESGVARVFQFAGMTIGAVGALAGVAYGLLLCWLVELYGHTLDPDVYFIERLPVEISPVQIGYVLLTTLVISFIATIPPCLRAAKLRPVEGLRYE